MVPGTIQFIPNLAFEMLTMHLVVLGLDVVYDRKVKNL